MSKSTRGRAGAARAGFEYFDRRQMGPWVLLRPLFRGRAVLATLALVVILTVTLQLNPYVMAALLVVGFLASFALVWQLVGLLIRARAVLFVLAVLIAANLWFTDLFGEVAGNLLLLALLLGLIGFPPTGRFLLARFWCVLDRHRMRACLKVCKVRTMNLDGSLPFMLWARPTKTGERVWLWIRAGASGEDIEDALSYIAPACFARDARIHRVRKLSTIVAVEVIRRDPLATGDAIPSPLSKLSDLVVGAVKGEGTEAIRTATVYDITTAEPPAASEPRRNGHKTTHTTKTAEPVETGVFVSGEDVSDYIN